MVYLSKGASPLAKICFTSLSFLYPLILSFIWVANNLFGKFIIKINTYFVCGWLHSKPLDIFQAADIWLIKIWKLIPLSQQIEFWIKYCDLFFFSPFFVYTYNFVCMDDVIYEAESALCNINKYHLHLNFKISLSLNIWVFHNRRLATSKKNHENYLLSGFSQIFLRAKMQSNWS